MSFFRLMLVPIALCWVWTLSIGDSHAQCISQSPDSAVCDEYDGLLDDFDDAQGGNAVAAALSGIHISNRAQHKLAFSAGYFEQYGALAVQTAVRFDDTFFWDGGIGINIPDNALGGRVAISGEW